MLPQLRAYLLENWPDLAMGTHLPRELTFLVQATGVSKVCCYIFADNEPDPRWVAKMPRTPRDNPILQREYDLIRHLRDRGSEYVRATVPGPIFTVSIDGHIVGVERHIEGRTMDGLMAGASLEQLRECLEMGIGWLLRCQQETVVFHGRLSDSQVERYLRTPLEQLRTNTRLTESELRFVEELERRVLKLADHPLPLVFNHGDFRPGNILLTGDGIRVIDWEFGAQAELPIYDVFSYLSRSYARYHAMEEIDGYLEDYLQAMEAVFFDQGAFSALTAEYVARACDDLKMDPAWISPLFAMFLIVEANKFRAFLGERAERGYVYLLRTREDRSLGSYLDQLDRQKNVWLLGHLADQPDRLIFRHQEHEPQVQPMITTHDAA